MNTTGFAIIQDREAELTALHAEIFGKPQAPNKHSTQGAVLSLDDTGLVNKARSATNGASFRRLYDQGDISGYPSPSEADFALCVQLAFWIGKDPERIDRLFRQSALFRDKWDQPNAGSTYGRRTIEKAISQTINFYDPQQYKHNNCQKTQASEKPPHIEWDDPDNVGLGPDDCERLERGSTQAKAGCPARELPGNPCVNNNNTNISTIDVSTIDDKIKTSGLFSEAEISYLSDLINQKALQAKDRIISAEIREWVMSSTGVFMSADVDRELGLSSMSSSRAEKRRIQKQLSKILERLVKEKIIERYGNQRGCFRRIEKECNAINFMSAPLESYEIRLPLNLERLVTIYRKNIIVVAGAPNAGKTAYLLNLIRMNMDNFPVVYFSSEMGESELRLRLENFGFPLTSWNFQAKERATNFHDAIDPDALNIIDFLEISDKFYEVGEMIRKIYDRLENGIAVIAIQKKAGADLGRGSEFSLEKARLYLSIDNNVLKIVKAKNWTQPGVNPNGREYSFKIVQGFRFTNITEI